MSGHSHWSTIKHKKEVTDKKRGKIFSKISRTISVAAREGEDPDANPQLRLAIDKARELNVPRENIERAIKKGLGEIEDESLEKFIYEAYGPGNVAIIIEGITDNKNRTSTEINQILSKNNGKLAESGSVKWMFERKGCIVADLESQTEGLKKRGELELKAIEAGAEDIYWHRNEENPENELLDIYTKVQDLEKVKKYLEKQGTKIQSASLDWIAKNQIKINGKERQACKKLFEELDENDAVQDIYSNLNVGQLRANTT